MNKEEIEKLEKEATQLFNKSIQRFVHPHPYCAQCKVLLCTVCGKHLTTFKKLKRQPVGVNASFIAPTVCAGAEKCKCNEVENVRTE